MVTRRSTLRTRVRDLSRIRTECEHGNSTHQKPVELVQDGLNRLALRSETVQHPIARPIELDDEGTELLGNGCGIKGLPEFLGTVIQKLGAVDVCGELLSVGKDGEHLAVASTSLIGDDSGLSIGGHFEWPSLEKETVTATSRSGCGTRSCRFLTGSRCSRRAAWLTIPSASMAMMEAARSAPISPSSTDSARLRYAAVMTHTRASLD